MKRKVVSCTMMTLLLVSMSILAFNVQPVKADGTYEVLGFLPYWIKNYEPRYEYLTHIAWFAVDVNSDGTISNPHGWPPTDIIVEAHSRDAKVILTARCFDKDTIDSVLAYYSSEVSNNLLSLVQDGNGDGVMIDFEGIRALNTYTNEQNALLLVQFMQILNGTFKEANSEYYVSICLPPVDWNNVFDCSELADYVDSFFIMAYDYHWKTSSIAGAVSPLEGDAYNARTTVNYYVSLANSKEFILGLPLYGWDWPTETGDKGSRTVDEAIAVIIEDAVKNAETYGYIWNDETKTPWYKYQEEYQWHQCWFDDVRSLRLKYRLAIDEKLRGIGYWALGYEGDHNEIYEAWVEETTKLVNVDVVLAIDRSGSMAWYGDVIHHFSGTLTSEWSKIDTFDIDSSVATFDVLLETGSGDGEQYLCIKSPAGKWCGYDYTSTYYPLDYTHDTYVKYLGADYIAIYQSGNVEQGTWEVYGKGILGRNYDLVIQVPPIRINAAKDAANYLMDIMSDRDQLGLVSFADSASLDRQLTLLDTIENRESISSAIDSLIAIGGTAMGDGINMATEELTSERHKPDSNPAIVLFTNGIWNTGSDPIQRANEAKDAGIRIYVIGFGRVDHSTLLEIKSITGGEYMYAPSASELKSMYLSMIAAAKGRSTVTSTAGTVRQDETSEQIVTIDSTISEASFSIGWTGSDLDLTLICPDSGLIDPAVAEADPDIRYVSAATYEIYHVRSPMPGTWTMVVTGVDVPPKGESFVAQVTALTSVTLTLVTDKDGYLYPEVMKITATLQENGIPLKGADTRATIRRSDASQIDIDLFDDGSDLHGDIDANDGIYTNYFTEFNEDGSYTIKVTSFGTTLTGESFSREDQKTVLVSGIPSDTTPPTTTLFVNSPQYIDQLSNLYVTSGTPFTLTAVDNNDGSGVALTGCKIYNSTYDSRWITDVPPISFQIEGLDDGTYYIDYNSTDNAGNVESTRTQPVILDNTQPLIVETNFEGLALQDGVTFEVSAWDLSEVASVTISIQCSQGDIIPPFESMLATLSSEGKWELDFDTSLLPDGFYSTIVNGTDVLGNTGNTTIPLSIRNWACLELLPASESNKAARTMPVKFSLRVVEGVDPAQPFVRNEELTIVIYEEGHSGNILQTSTYGDTARDYRIDSDNELYITNFRTAKKKPTTYVVEINRKDMLIGSFEFSTVK